MCIAIWKPQGLVLTPTTIQECWNSNQDGAGFMYHEDGKLIVTKGLMTLEDFQIAYEPHKNKDCVLHFRIKTHGNTDQENTHPFLVDKDLGVVHNGIISKVNTKTDPTKSDTHHFTASHLHRFRQDNQDFYLNPIYKEIIEDFIGYSKLIFMDATGNVEIFNENKGVWDAGCWFSNTSYRPYVAPKTRWNPQQQNLPGLPKKETKPSDFMLKTGDTCQTLYDAYPGIKGDLDFVIPKGTWVKITYFKAANIVGIKEILTDLTAEVHVSFLETLQNIKKKEDEDVKVIPLQDEQFQLKEIETLLGNNSSLL